MVFIETKDSVLNNNKVVIATNKPIFKTIYISTHSQTIINKFT